MKFQLYLKEGRSQSLSFDQFLKLAPRCKNSIRNYMYGTSNKGALMRGVSTGGKNFDEYAESNYGDFMSVNPKDFTRKPNFASSGMYFVMIEGLPSWSNFPSRRTSVVGATHGGKSDAYAMAGHYQMFPEDSAKIAVCSGRDLWSSFTKIFDNSKFDEVLGQFVDEAIDLVSNGNRSFKIDTVSDLKEYCKKVDNMFNRRFKGDLGKFNRAIDEDGAYRLHQFTKKYYNGNMWDALDKAFSPKENVIRQFKPGSKLPEGREWWTDGFCLMLSDERRLEDDEHMAIKKAVGL